MSFQPRSRLKAPDLGCFSLFSLDPAQHCPDALGCPQGFSEAPGPVAFFGKNEKKSNRRKMLEKSQAKSIMVVHGGHSTHFLTKIESRSQRSNPRGWLHLPLPAATEHAATGSKEKILKSAASAVRPLQYNTLHDLQCLP